MPVTWNEGGLRRPEEDAARTKEISAKTVSWFHRTGTHSGQSLGEEAQMPTWLWVLILVLVVLALFGGVGYSRG